MLSNGINRDRIQQESIMNLRLFQVLCFSLAITTMTHGVLINSTGKRFFERPVGGSVKLECRFTLDPEDTGPLEIEWARTFGGGTPDLQIILYHAGQVYDHYHPPLTNRVFFSSADPMNGEASINLQLLTPSDSGTYKCQVKKVPGIRAIKYTLRVLDPPSKPLCYTEGTAEVDRGLVLHCKVEKGASPIDYFWQRTAGSLSSSALVDNVAGKIHILQASESDSGTYLCTARNRVGVAECFLDVKITRPSMAGMISAVVVSVLVVLGVSGFVIYRWCKSKGEIVEEDTGKDIREDASPPKNRKSATSEYVNFNK